MSMEILTVERRRPSTVSVQIIGWFGILLLIVLMPAHAKELQGNAVLRSRRVIVVRSRRTRRTE